MSYLTEELKVESLYLLNYFMKSEQDESGSKELGFILDKITKRSDFVKASKGQYIKTCALFLQKVKSEGFFLLTARGHFPRFFHSEVMHIAQL